MNKVLIVTLQGDNFGNRLQNYALQTVIEKLGYEADTLTVKRIALQPDQKVKNVIKKILAAFGLKRFIRNISVRARRKSCRCFSISHIHNYLFVPQHKLNGYNFKQYNAVVTGSDQVWHNWNSIPNELSYYYLEFIDQNKRIAYAPSFGFTEFPEKDIEIHKRGLLGMKSLSCREKEGCDLIKSLTGRNALKVLDPTLLLRKEEWEDVEEKPKFNVPEQYLLQYMLGSVSNDFHEEIQEISKRRNLSIININDKNNGERYGISPAEFIWLIHHADTVCTDSFHGTVFSIIFERNLQVFERISPALGNMFGRLRDLLTPLDLMHLVYENKLHQDKKLSTTLGEKAKVYLQNEREKSFRYLRDNLS